MIRQGISARVIAEKFGISPGTVRYIKSGRHWAHVKITGGAAVKAVK